ncbi:MAG: hypothetical protein J6S36_02200 [Eggerthellaceae bacterium]|nr:hypothetical protein [Eggerthellaceae bacterium]
MRVTPPSVWVALAAFAVLIAGLLAWAIFGTIATRVPATAAVVNGQTVCFLSEDDIVKMHVGDQADIDGEALGIDGVTLKVSSISNLPVSRAESVQIDAANLANEETLPCIALWKQGDFVVVAGFQGNHVHLNDPAHGETKVTLAEFEESYDGTALLFKKTDAFKPGGERLS